MNRRKKRIYLSLIALSAVGLLVDRLVMPASSSGAEIVLPRSSTRAPVAVPLPKVGSETGEAAPAVVLAATRFPAQLPGPGLWSRDLFGPTETVQARLGHSPEDGSGFAESGPDNARLSQARAAEFSQTHTLSAVVYDEQFAIAILDGAWVRVGQSVDGCTLAHILGQSAQFDCGGVFVELSVGRTELESQPEQ